MNYSLGTASPTASTGFIISLCPETEIFFFFMMNLSTILSKLILPSSVSLGQFAFTVSGDLCTLVSVHLALAVAEQIGSRASS